jgi:hypothetical protein
MTEAEWLASTPSVMLNFLEDSASERKLRLFACACCRQIWHLLTKEVCRDALEVAERYADGQADDHQLSEVNRVVWEAVRVTTGRSMGAAFCVGYASDALVLPIAASSSTNVSLTSHRNLCRDLFGPLPFRSVSIASSVLTWNDATVVRLAQAAYQERQLPSGTLDTYRLAILADALEEAGCTSEDILDHLRGPGPHVRGCWVVDLLLGKY